MARMSLRFASIRTGKYSNWIIALCSPWKAGPFIVRTFGIGGTLVIERGSGSGWVRHRARAANPDQPARDGNAASQPPEDTDAMCIGPNALSSLSLERLNEVQR